MKSKIHVSENTPRMQEADMSLTSLSNISIFWQVPTIGRVDGRQQFHAAQNEKWSTPGCSNNRNIIITITAFNIWD